MAVSEVVPRCRCCRTGQRTGRPRILNDPLFTSSTQDVEMTYYPKASAAPTGAGATTSASNTSGVSASVKFPEIEERILKYWDEDGTFQASIDQRAPTAGGRPGSNEFVFYDGPPFANGLPHYGHLLTGYAKDLVGRYQTQRGQPGGAPLRLGHPRAARRTGSHEAAGHDGQEPDRGHGHRQVQRRLPRLRDEVRRRVAELRHPPGPLGGLRERLQDAQRRVHGVRAVGLQAAARKGPHLQRLPRAAVLLEGRDAAVQP